MQAVNAAFTALGQSNPLPIQTNDTVKLNVSGVFVGAWALVYTVDNTEYHQIAAGNGPQLIETVATRGDGTLGPVSYYVQCTAYTSGTMNASLTREETNLKSSISTDGKPGATAGWTGSLAAAANTFYSSCPSNKAGATLIVPVDGLKVGDVISSFDLLGSLTAAGVLSTIDASLHSLNAAAGSITDANLQAMTQLVSASANIVLGPANTHTVLAQEHTVQAGETFYVIVTATTDVADSVALQGVQINIR